MVQRITIPARRGKAASLRAGQKVKVINTHGQQVVDTWAFVAGDMNEFMSMEHSRAALANLRPKTGDFLYTNHRRAILRLVDDTSSKIHDTLIAACDIFRYQLLGCEGYHDNCTDNLTAGLRELGLVPQGTPSPLNLFMNIPWTAEGKLTFEAPPTIPGGYVLFEAQIDLVIACSACPQDIVPINGAACKPTEAHLEILD
jgi:uncharacterized protein YcgI (DUF1989 family)